MTDVHTYNYSLLLTGLLYNNTTNPTLSEMDESLQIFVVAIIIVGAIIINGILAIVAIALVVVLVRKRRRQRISKLK